MENLDAVKSRFSHLEDEVRRADEDSVEFPVMLANHLPMILVALDRLGADSDRLHEWAEHYRELKGVVLAEASTGAVSESDWRDALGDRSRETDLRLFFVGRVAILGIRRALETYLPELAEGIGASALHGLMRLSYALLREDPIEVGHSLGYIAATFLPAPPIAASPEWSSSNPAEVLARVAAIPKVFQVTPSSDLLWHTAQAVFAVPEFRPAGSWLRTQPDTLAQLAAVSLRLYANSMCFTSLHAVTGTHWLRIVLAYLPDGAAAQKLVARYWQTVLALLPKVEDPRLLDEDRANELRGSEAPTWREIAHEAIMSWDEHDISLTFSAMQEDAIYRDPLYRVVAARRVGLLR